MLKPKKIKFKKLQNKKTKKLFSYQFSKEINFFIQRSVFLVSKESGFLTSKQLEIGKKLIQKLLNKKGKTFIKVFPHTPISRKPIGSRIGKGKGAVSFWVSKIYFGQQIYEIKDVFDSNSLIKVKTNLSKKFPIKLELKTNFKIKNN